MGAIKILFTISLIVLMGCKEESARSDAIDSTFEGEYFEDYESPRFKWGYVDRSGRLAIDSKYDDCRDFSGGLAAVNFQGKWGYIDTSGAKAVDFIFRAAHSFSSGIGLIQHFDKRYQYINKSGEATIDKYFDEAWPFHDGIARVKIDGRFVYINEAGIPINDESYLQASNFKNGYAIVSDQNGEHIIDDQGNKLFEGLKGKLYRPSDGLIRISNDGRFKFYSIDKNEINSKNYQDARDYYNGVAAVKDGRWHLINRNFEKISSDYEHIEYAGEGMWMCSKEGKYGLLNSNGKRVTENKYDIIYRFSEGVSAYAIDDLWGLISISGDEITGPVFPLLWEFRNGYVRAIFNGRVGFLDRQGNMAIKPKFIEVRDFYEGLARVQIVN